MLALAAAIVMLVGMVGIVAPFVPGLLLIWLAALAYGILGDFGTGGIIAFSVISGLFVVGEVLGYFLPGRSAAKAGASVQSIVIGAVAACVGFFVIPVFGFPIGGVIGVFAAEYLRTNDTQRAWQTTWSTLVGFGISALAQLVFGFLMIATWGLWVLLA